MELQFQQIEAYLLNATYWNYDLYNTVDNKDNWNLENFSLLGPNRIPRHIDIVARPYPKFSSAEPYHVFFDLSKYCIIVLKGPVVQAPTLIYIPYRIHYFPAFKIWATSNHFEWQSDEQIMNWWPDGNKTLNQIIITPTIDKVDNSILPQISNDLLLKDTNFTQEFGT